VDVVSAATAHVVGALAAARLTVGRQVDRATGLVACACAVAILVHAAPAAAAQPVPADLRVAAAATGTSANRARPVVVGSKPFGEGYLLAELFAQVLEARGLAVQRRFGLGGTEIIFPAMQRGDIDVYPEYTGTGMLVILKAPARTDPSEVFDLVSREFPARFDIRWLAPLGFENTYAMSVRTDMAERLGLRTLTDLARVGSQMRAGFTADFIGLPDGLPGLRRAYGFEPREVNPLAPAVKYQALMAGDVDVIDAYSTDGLLGRYPLTVLADDKRFFPPYDAAALVRGALARERPDAVAALGELSGRLDVRRMRQLNERVEVRREPVALVAADALRDLGLLAGPGVTARPAPTPAGNRAPSLLSYMWTSRTAIGVATWRHLWLAAASLLLAVLVAVPLGVALERVRLAEGVLGAVGVLQTIPSIALLAFMLPVLGIGVAPAIVALFLYSLYPIARGTYAGVRAADASAVDAAHALGMTPGQVLRHVRLPLAAPIIMTGIRTAAVMNVGTATLAAFIGAGGLGEPIVAGLALADTRMILSGAVPAAVLAVLVDWTLGRVQRYVSARTDAARA
jgi:osmoprotectant transport system permease protein